MATTVSTNQTPINNSSSIILEEQVVDNTPSSNYGTNSTEQTHINDQDQFIYKSDSRHELVSNPSIQILVQADNTQEGDEYTPEGALLDAYETNPLTEYINLSDMKVTDIEPLESFFVELKQLKDVNLEDNQITSLPKDMSAMFPLLENLNIDGMDWPDDDTFEEIIKCVKTIPNLKSLYIKVNDHERIHNMLQVLDALEYLNGIPVEHEDCVGATKDKLNDSFGTDPGEETINNDAEQQQATAEQEEETEVKETVQEFLEKVLQENPDVDFLDLSEQGIMSLEEISSYLIHLTKLQDLNLGENPITSLPSDLSQIIPNVQNLNLNGMDFAEQFDQLIESLMTLPNLKSLYIQLDSEEAVDQLMSQMTELQFLNGHEVEREQVHEFEEGEDDDEDDFERYEVDREENVIVELDEEEGTYDDIQRTQNNESLLQLDQSLRNLYHHNRQQDYYGGLEDFQSSQSVTRLPDLDKAMQQVKKNYNTMETTTPQHQLEEDLDLSKQQSQNTVENIPVKMLAKQSLKDLFTDYNVQSDNYQTSSQELIDDFKSVIQESGLNFEIIKKIAKTYDILRKTRIQTHGQIEPHSDRMMKQDFTQMFNHMIESLQAAKLQHQSQEILNVNSNLIMINLLNTKIMEHFQFVDSQILPAYQGISQIYLQLLSSCLQMYQNEITESPLTEEIYSLRNINEKLEERLIRESSANKMNKLKLARQDKIIEQLKSELASQQLQQVTTPRKVKTPSTKKKPKSTKKKQYLTTVSKPAASGPLGKTNSKILSQKQVTLIVNDIMNNKVKFDKKCQETNLVRETMEQYMYTYFNQRYGLKSLIIENIVSLINSIKIYGSEEHDVKLFQQILVNNCNEEFRATQIQVKATIMTLLKAIIKDKYQYKAETDVLKTIETIENGNVSSWIWNRIINNLYDQQDVEALKVKFQSQLLHRNQNQPMVPGISAKIQQKPTKKKAQSGQDQQIGDKLLWIDFIKCILDYQLEQHQLSLKLVCDAYSEVDDKNSGQISQDQLRLMLQNMQAHSDSKIQSLNLPQNRDEFVDLQFIHSDQELSYMIQLIDPNFNNSITYSDVIILFQSHMVPSENPIKESYISLIEKYINLLNFDTENYEIIKQQLDNQQAIDTFNTSKDQQSLFENQFGQFHNDDLNNYQSAKFNEGTPQQDQGLQMNISGIEIDLNEDMDSPHNYLNTIPETQEITQSPRAAGIQMNTTPDEKNVQISNLEIANNESSKLLGQSKSKPSFMQENSKSQKSNIGNTQTVTPTREEIQTPKVRQIEQNLNVQIEDQSQEYTKDKPSINLQKVQDEPQNTDYSTFGRKNEEDENDSKQEPEQNPENQKNLDEVITKQNSEEQLHREHAASYINSIKNNFIKDKRKEIKTKSIDVVNRIGVHLSRSKSGSRNISRSNSMQTSRKNSDNHDKSTEQKEFFDKVGEKLNRELTEKIGIAPVKEEVNQEQQMRLEVPE